MNNTMSLTDELTGRTGIKNNRRGVGFGDLIVISLDAVLLTYTAWRSYDFLTTTVPTGFEILGLIGLWGLDIGTVGWSLVWMFGSSSKYQDWTSMALFLVDLVGVILTSVTDSLMYGAKDGAMTHMLTGITSVAIPLVIVGNVVAGFIYHMTSPDTKARREERKADEAHREKMIEITAMERDLLYAESYLLAKQDTLDKAVLLAEIKKSQDAVEKSTRDSLRDQVGIRKAASAGEDSSIKIDELKNRLAEMAKKLVEPKVDETQSQQLPIPAAPFDADLPQPQTTEVPQAKIVPVLQIPSIYANHDLIRFASKIACSLGRQVINIGDELVAKKNLERYDIGKPNEAFAFANISEEDFNTLRNGLPLMPELALVKGNGHNKLELDPT